MKAKQNFRKLTFEEDSPGKSSGDELPFFSDTTNSRNEGFDVQFISLRLGLQFVRVNTKAEREMTTQETPSFCGYDSPPSLTVKTRCSGSDS